jgi:glycosyltransferase involved in cell wall biosynthesis
VRVLYFSQDYTPHDFRFLSALTENDDDVLYLRLENRRNQESRPLPSGVELIEWWGGGKGIDWSDIPRLLLELHGVLGRVKPDIVHAGPIQRCAFPISLLGFRPLVSMSWGSDLLAGARRGVGRAEARFTLGRSAALIADCQAVRQAAIALGMRDDRIVVFPWGVDLGRFHPAKASSLRADLGWGDAFVLISTRAWEPIYGINIIAEGFCRATAVDPRLRLLMLGDGSQAKWLRRKFDDERISDRVHIAGQIDYDRLPDFYHAADLYLSASHSDGSSVSLLEAMACGLPALVSDIPGNREWVEPGKNGWWFSDGDAEGLATAIARAASHDELVALGRQARLVAEQKADWSRNAGMIREAYRLAVGGAAQGIT